MVNDTVPFVVYTSPGEDPAGVIIVRFYSRNLPHLFPQGVAHHNLIFILTGRCSGLHYLYGSLAADMPESPAFPRRLVMRSWRSVFRLSVIVAAWVSMAWAAPL